MISLSDLRNKIESNEINAQTAIRNSFARIDAKESDIRAFTHISQHREQLLEDGKQTNGPLAGITVGVKDVLDTYDMPTRYGSSIYENHTPKCDASLVTMLRNAGATIIGKTVTTEFAFFTPGPTRNPHNLNHTPGGSSSGSAASVAAGMIPAAIGTQTGGSVIRPASFCGVAGYKPSFRLTPTVGMKCMSWSLDTVGFFAKSVEDVAYLAASALSRPLHATPPPLKGYRLGLYRSSHWGEVDRPMQKALENLAHLAAQEGAIIIEIEEDDHLAHGRNNHSIIQDYEIAISMGDEYARFQDQLSSTLQGAIENGRACSPQNYDAARKIARQARKQANRLLSELDAIITPSALGAAPNGHANTGSPLMNKLWTLTGCPCVNIPGFKDEQGLPLGMQLVARFGRDFEALSIASSLEIIIKKNQI